MSMEYIVLEEGTLIIERWLGDISHETYMEHEKKQLEDNSIMPGTIALVDTRNSNFLTSMDKVPELYALYSREDYLNRYKKIAILTSNLSLEKAKIFEKFAQESLDLDVIVFDNLDAACKWLQINANQALQYLNDIALTTADRNLCKPIDK